MVLTFISVLQNQVQEIGVQHGSGALRSNNKEFVSPIALQHYRCRAVCVLRDACSKLTFRLVGEGRIGEEEVPVFSVLFFGDLREKL